MGQCASHDRLISRHSTVRPLWQIGFNAWRTFCIGAWYTGINSQHPILKHFDTILEHVIVWQCQWIKPLLSDCLAGLSTIFSQVREFTATNMKCSFGFVEFTVGQVLVYALFYTLLTVSDLTSSERKRNLCQKRIPQKHVGFPRTHC